MADPLSGEQLYADVCRFESFGLHRYGSPGAAAALAWIEGELRQTGLRVTRQPFTVSRQYELEAGTLEVGGQRLAVLPQWWMPEARARFYLRAPIAPGGFVRLTLPFDRGAYLNDRHREALDRTFTHHPAAVLLSIDHPSGEIFTYNVDQASAPWPVPVILVPPKHRAMLDVAERTGATITVDVQGRYRRQVASHNVIGRLDRGKGRWIVVSTPVTSWFTSTCERGPGIAAFLALARLAATGMADVDLMFVATAGHEIGHGGMEHFLRAAAPRPAATLAWAHLGATLASHDMMVRVIARSASLERLTDRHFAEITGTRLTGDDAAVGEIRNVHAAGYPAFFGMAGIHRFFHTPADSAAGTGPELLAPVAAAFAGALIEIGG